MRSPLPLRVLSLAAALALAGCATTRVVLVPPSDPFGTAPVTLVTGVNLFDGEKALGGVHPEGASALDVRAGRGVGPHHRGEPAEAAGGRRAAR
ncbi:MAG: hypothetical protein ACYC8T_07750 [Myxococcaceae bacterium]